MKRLLDAPTFAWLALLLVTAANFAVGSLGWGGTSVVGAVLVATFIKGHVLVDWFMGLRGVSWRWRGVLTGYLAVVLGAIALAYSLGATP